MSAIILPLPTVKASSQTIGHYIRIGHASHRMESLLVQGHLSARRVVIEASALRSQRGLVSALHSQGTEIVLDTNADELSELGRYAGYVKSAPWASLADVGPLSPHHFKRDHPGDIFGQIARTAVANHVSAVLAPSHFLRR